MPEIILFCEDSFHEKFISAVLGRLAGLHEVRVELRIFSAVKGLPRMKGEFTQFLVDLQRDRAPRPDALIVVADANSLGYNDRKREFDTVLATFGEVGVPITYAIPDPHIERWMLADSRAFRAVFQRGCTVPAVKCRKDEYKRLLRQELRDGGVDAPLGGQEYAEEIVQAMDFSRMETREPSLRLFLRDAKAMFNAWAAH